MSAARLSFEGVWKRFGTPGGSSRDVLRGLDLDVPPGRRLAVVGRSGTGKSTFLHLAAGIDLPSAGRVLIDGRDLAGLPEGERVRLRRDTVGLVFQFFHLLPHLSVRDNVALPALIAGDAPDRYLGRLRELLQRVGLGDREGDAVQKLSGGEMQRVALCRALLRRPRLLLADEPTGNLDEASGRTVMDLLLRLAGEEESTLVYVTHSRELAEMADSVLRMHAGVLASL